MNTLTTKQRQLLDKLLPDNPCNNNCVGKPYCCGCPAQHDYEKSIQMYKDANVLDIALKLKQLHDYEQKIKQYETLYAEVNATLPDELKVKIAEYFTIYK